VETNRLPASLGSSTIASEGRDFWLRTQLGIRGWVMEGQWVL